MAGASLWHVIANFSASGKVNKGIEIAGESGDQYGCCWRKCGYASSGLPGLWQL